MTEDEWQQTGPGRATQSFEAFVASIGLSTIGGVVGGSVMSALGQAADQAGRLSPRLAALLNPKREANIPAAMAVIATWSAFEAWAQDFAKALMQADPYTLDRKEIKDRKYSISDLMAPESERLDTVYRALYSSMGRKKGTDRYDELFAALGLDPETPRGVKETFYIAQLVRHVWVHNAGTADSEFVKRARDLDVSEGQLVEVPFEAMSNYMSAIICYVYIVANRQRAIHGLGPLPIDGKAGEAPIGRAYNNFYAP